MEILAFYLLKVIGLQTLLFGLYWLLCRNSNRFHFNRYFLLSTLLLPFIIPLFKFQLPIFTEQITTLPAIPVFNAGSHADNSEISNLAMDHGQVATSGNAWWIYILIGIYLIVAIPFAFRFIKNYIKIHRTIRQSSRKEITPGGFKLFYVSSKILSFSFLNWIFLSDLFALKAEEKKIIVAHEEYHLKHKHSLDIIAAECIRIFCWFNPIILLIQKNLKDTHEFLTDRHTVNQFGKNEYGNLLKSYQYQEINIMLGHAYSSSSIQNRLKMMETKKSPTYKIVLLCTVAILTSFLFACEDDMKSMESQEPLTIATIGDEQLMEEINQTLERIKDAPEDFKEAYKNIQLENPDIFYTPSISIGMNNAFYEKMKNGEVELIGPGVSGKTTFTYFRTLKFEETNKYFSSNKYYRERIAKSNSTKESLAYLRSHNRAEYFEYRAKENGNDTRIYKQVDIKPRFKEGAIALTNYFKSNLNYPELAKQKGIEAEVTMRFMVSSRGNIIQLNVESATEMEDEALSLEFRKAAYHAVKSTEGKWKPAEKNGKFVNYQMFLPIKFELNN